MRHALCCALLFASCQSSEKPTASSKPSAATSSLASKPEPSPQARPGARTDMTSAIGAASRAAIGDFDGDRDRELAVVDAKQLRVLDASGKQVASAPVTAGIQVLVTGDIDRDGRDEIYAGWGQTRDFRDSTARITVHRLRGSELVEETIVAPSTPRADVAAIVPMPDAVAVLVAYFDSKYNVTSAVARKSGDSWKLDTIASIRMATSYARGDFGGDGKRDLVVGRTYGDDIGIDGDAFVLEPDGSRTKLPTTRGLRSIAFVGNDVFMGDGWHQNYGQHARGLLTRVSKTSEGIRAELVEDTQGQYAIERILPATIDGKQVIVTLGSHYVRVFAKTGETWRGLTIAGAARDIAVGDLDGTAGDEIVVVGDTSELVQLRGVAY